MSAISYAYKGNDCPAQNIDKLVTCDNNFHHSLLNNIENDQKSLKYGDSPTMLLSAFSSTNEGHDVILGLLQISGIKEGF